MCVDDSYSEWCSKRFASQQDVRELDRIYARVDSRPSTSSDADAASTAECRRIYLLNPVEQQRLPDQQLIITPTDLRVEAQRLIAAGRMPSLDQLLEAVADTRVEYRDQIIAARKRGKRSGAQRSRQCR